MGQDFAFLFKPGDYLRDTQCLSEKSQVAYDRIMCEHIRNISSSYENHIDNHTDNIGITQQQLNFFTKRLNDTERDELLFVIRKINDIYHIPWVAQSVCDRRNYTSSRSKNRKGKNKNHMKSYDQHMENDNDNNNEIDNKEYNIINTNMASEKKIEVEVKNLGKMDVVFLDDGNPWRWQQYDDFFHNSQTAFETIVIRHKSLNSPECFRRALQAFVYNSQISSDKQTSNQIRKHFGNWLNSLNGKLEQIIHPENFTDATNKSATTSNSTKPGTSQARIDALKKW